MARVQIQFDGVARGAVSAGRATRTELREVGTQAHRTNSELGKLSRGAVAGSGAFRGLGRSIAFASTGFLGAFGLTAAIGGAITELRESVRVSAQTSQALRSTGNVAGTTAKQIDQMANALLRKTGVDDEAIKTSANLLLTFTQVRNEAGKGNDIFNQSVRAIVDMSAVIGDLSSNSIQLGKALNDPVTGMTALRRVGVSFTAQQREQIKTLVEHGRLLEAQKIILGEVQREFGGQAAAQEKATGGLNTLRESIRNTSADLLRTLIPSFKDGVTWLQKWVDWLQNTREGQARLRGVANGLRDALQAVVDVIKIAVGGIRLLNRITGGFKETIELLIGLKLASVLAGWAGGFRKLAVAEAIAAGTAEGAGAKGLLASLTRLKGLGVISIGIELLIAQRLLGDDPLGIGGLRKHHGITDIIFGPPGHRGALGNLLVGSGETGARAPGAAERGAGSIGSLVGIGGGRGNRRARSTAQAIAAVAASQIGIPYRWGGPAILGHSTDCSGLTQAVLAKSGVHVGRTTYEQWRQGHPVDPRHLQPGDLVFFHMGRRGPEHVGIYIGNGQFIEDPHTGASVRVSNLVGRGGFVGARRYIADILGGASAPAQFTPHDASAAAAQRPAGRARAAGTAAASRATGRARATTGDGWQFVAGSGIKGAAAAAKKQAQEAADELARTLDRQFRDASTGLFRIFDRETDRHVREFQRGTETALKGMRKAFADQLDAFDEETRRGLEGFVVPQTGEELALAQFQAARQAEEDARRMAEAQASGDPEQIRQLQLDLQERALEQAARASREAQDQSTQEAQRAYEKQRSQQRTALEEREADLEQSFTDQREATLAAYQQQRDDERTHLQDNLDDWNEWIDHKQDRWRKFLEWLAGHGFKVPGDMLQPSDEEVSKRLFDFGIIPRSRPGEGVPLQRGGTIRASRFVGRGDVLPAKLAHNETVIESDLTDWLRSVRNGGGGLGGDVKVDIHINGNFLGSDERKIAYALARPIASEMNRLVGG